MLTSMGRLLIYAPFVLLSYARTPKRVACHIAIRCIMPNLIKSKNLISKS